MNGPELRKFRRDAEVEVAPLARLIKLRRQRVFELELRAHVPPDLEKRYIAGVEKLRRITP